jgi:hypothetical protein
MPSIHNLYGKAISSPSLNFQRREQTTYVNGRQRNTAMQSRGYVTTVFLKLLLRLLVSFCNGSGPQNCWDLTRTWSLVCQAKNRVGSKDEQWGHPCCLLPRSSTHVCAESAAFPLTNGRCSFTSRNDCLQGQSPTDGRPLGIVYETSHVISVAHLDPGRNIHKLTGIRMARMHHKLVLGSNQVSTEENRGVSLV